MADTSERTMKHVGEVYVFRFLECNPDDLRAHPEDDLFMVYDGDRVPRLCVWGEGAFWHRWGETDADWEVVMNVQYWFRVPTNKEITDG